MMLSVWSTLNRYTGPREVAPVDANVLDDELLWIPRAQDEKGTRRLASCRTWRPEPFDKSAKARRTPWNDWSIISVTVAGTVLRFSTPPPFEWMMEIRIGVVLNPGVQVGKGIVQGSLLGQGRWPGRT